MGNGTPFQHSAAVNQACGMVSVQAACSMDEALVLMQDRATVQGQMLEEIAAGVIDRSIRFGE
jgi:AmiR/NasT family two-component response regulator